MKKIIMILGIILSVTWMIVIFTYSNKSGEQVDEKANTIIQTITVSDETYQQKTEEEKILVNNDYEFYISKTVHVLEYGALCFFLLMAFILVKKRSLNYLFSFIITVLFAISDLVLSGTYFGKGKERPIDFILNYITYLRNVKLNVLVYTIFN